MAGNPNWQPGGKDYRPASGDNLNGAAGGMDLNRGDAAPVFGADHQPDAESRSQGQVNRQEMRALLQANRMTAARKIIEIVTMVENTTLQLAAANSLIDRLDGKPTVAISGPDGEALPATIAVSFVRPGNHT